MRELSDLFESLYSHFILRDILAKVLPGVIGLVSLVALLAPKSLQHLSHDLPEPDLLMVVIVYGVSFMFGMLIQYLGSLTPFIDIHVWKESSRKLSIATSLSKAVEFQKVASNDQALLRQRERFAVLKEMAANYSFSLFLSLLAVVRNVILTRSGLQPSAIPLGILLIVFIVALIFQNRLHASEQQIWEEQVIEQFSSKGPAQNNAAG